MKSRLYFIIVLVLVFAHCATSKGVVTFDSLKYSASMNNLLYSPDGKMISTRNGLKTVGDFKVSKTFYGSCSFFSSFSLFLPYSTEHSLVNAINTAVQKAGGDAIINMKVKVKQSRYNQCFNCSITYRSWSAHCYNNWCYCKTGSEHKS